MEEAFLHFIWKHKKFNFTNLTTTQGDEVVIVQTGLHNDNAGPDFFNSKIKIAGQLWVGNVEMHLKSSLWFVHQHQNDPNYDNVVLHVVWEHDAEVYRNDNTKIPVLELKNYVPENALQKYYHLVEQGASKFINCENDFSDFDDFTIENWLERLYFERLEIKSALVFQILEKSEHDWEAALFKLLAKNFGLNVNADSFISIANATPFSVIRKLAGNNFQLEAVLLGQAQLLNQEVDDPYFLKLKNEYTYLKRKYDLNSSGVIPANFFRLRPDNFPTVRLAQLASLYGKKTAMFAEIIAATEAAELREILKTKVSPYWKTHYTFKKESNNRTETLSDNMIDLLIINTIVPVKFTFAQYHGREVNDEIIKLVSSIKAESNSLVKNYNSLRKGTARNALQSQALIQLKKEFCEKHQCLKCGLGTVLLK